MNMVTIVSSSYRQNRGDRGISVSVDQAFPMDLLTSFGVSPTLMHNATVSL